MKNAVKVSIFLALHIFCYFILELKETTIIGTQNFVLLYILFNLLFVAGLCLYGFFQKWILKILRNSIFLFLFCFIYLALGVTSYISNNAIYLVSVGLATVMTGILGGTAYFSIYAVIPKWWRGRVLAAGVCGGTLIQYFVEFAQLLLNNTVSFYIYVGVFCIAVSGSFLLLLDMSILQTDRAKTNSDTNDEQSNPQTLFILLVSAVAIICYLSSLYEGVMITAYPGGEQSFYVMLLLKNTRLLYSASVIVAGIIADIKGRQYLPLISVIVMTILILNVFLLNFPAVRILNWVLLFIGAGFLVMFVTLNFIDIASHAKTPALWTGGGRIIKHSVTAFGSCLGVYFWSNPVTGLFVILIQYLVLLVVLIFLLFRVYQLLTQTACSGDIFETKIITSTNQGELPTQAVEASPFSLESEIKKYSFTTREKQILSFILTGAQIKEIAKELYITERTVKFHITNILTKTGVKNQKELISSLVYKNNSLPNIL